MKIRFTVPGKPAGKGRSRASTAGGNAAVHLSAAAGGICPGLPGLLGLLIPGFSALKAALNGPIRVPLAFGGPASLAGAAAERSGKR